MSTLSHITLVSLISLLLTGPVYADECKNFEKYLAKVSDLDSGSVGQHIRVFKKRAGQVGCTDEKVYFEFNRKHLADNDSMLGIYDEYLLISTGGDVDSNTLLVTDLRTKKQILEVPNLQDFAIRGDHLKYSTKNHQLKVQGDPAGCQARLETSIGAWVQANKIETQFKLKDCQCGDLIKEVGHAIPVFQIDIDLRSQKRLYLPDVLCSFVQ